MRGEYDGFIGSRLRVSRARFGGREERIFRLGKGGEGEEDEDDEDDDEMEVYEKLDAGCEERGDEGGKERRGDGDATAQNTTKSTIQTLGRKRKTNTNGKRNSDS